MSDLNYSYTQKLAMQVYLGNIIIANYKFKLPNWNSICSNFMVKMKII